MSLFRRPYPVRRFGIQDIVNGRAVSAYEDMVLQLNIQPLNSDELQALPEGERSVRRLKAFGPQLHVSDEKTQAQGDWLWYVDRWYRCKSSIRRDHTPVGHFRSELVEVPEGEAKRVTPPGEATAL